jgi:hypothetical protein
MQHDRLQLARFSQDSLQDAGLRHTYPARPNPTSKNGTGAASRSSLEPGDFARACSDFWPGRCGNPRSDCSVAQRALLLPA